MTEKHNIIGKKTVVFNLITETEIPEIDFTNPGTNGTIKRSGISKFRIPELHPLLVVVGYMELLLAFCK